MKIEPPKIDERKFSDLYKTLREMVPHYTPEWAASDEKDSGVALLKIYSHITESVITRFNQVPRKNFVAFLDMLGIKLLPAQPSRVPITFKLAKGTDKEILIPAGTQAAADKTEEHEELPFETEKNLWATPSQLIKVISVDPFQDAIYMPPPDFLSEEPKSRVQLSYKIVSPPSAGVKNFQLDHVTDLKKGHFLRIGKGKDIGGEATTLDDPICSPYDKLTTKSSSEYVIISGISGNIVSISDSLLRSYPVGTPVEKVTRFNLFEGKNMQEHSLYIGHKDLFNIEGAGKITIEVALAPGTEVGNPSLNLIWEYWGEDKEKEKDAWLSLQVEDDETNGFKQSGRITLLKTVEGKIKEEKLDDIFKKTSRVEINDETIKEIKTRWIRCRLRDALTDTSAIKLPTIDTIFIKTSPSVPVLPDAGFFNDVPLDWTKVTHETKVTDCGNIEIIHVSASPLKTTAVYVDSVEGFMVGDKVDIIRNGITLKVATITNIQFDENKLELSYEGDYTCAINDIIRLSEKSSKVFVFGSQPRLYDTFFIGSQEAFSKKGAKITLYLSLIHLDTSGGLTIDPKLSWEYWNGTGWQALTMVKDETDRFLNAGGNLLIEFYCQEDIEETEVSGQKNYWIRSKIVGGDYGREEYILEESRSTATDKKEVKTRVERKFKLPVIRDLSISYSFDTKEELQYCLTYNNLTHQVKTSESKTQGLYFQPFIPMDDEYQSIYLGFDKPLKSRPIRIFFDAKELSYTEEKKPKMDWNYWNNTDWALLDYLDETEGLIVRGHLELIGPTDFSAQSRFGNYLYWIKGGLTEGEYEESPLLDGIYPNTTWAIQAETIKEEILGSSDGQPDQTFTFLKFPVLEGQEIRVREVLSEEEKGVIKDLLGEDAIFEVKDEKGEVTETWVFWTEVLDFFDSTEKSRHYTLNRATGQLQFGDGVNGMIPPAGDDNIKAFSYQAGGGANGNIGAGEIKTLKSAVAGVDKVLNLVAADGGADTATLDEMLEIGPAMISHRNRAVTVEDFEWLAKQASRKVVKVRCLSNSNNKGQREVGWVTVIIVPDSKEDKPQPSLELKRKVQKYLETHSANTLMSAQHIHVDDPSYVEISVSSDVFVTSIDVASEVEREVKSKLKAFFHPLTGGPEEKGWEFGRDVSASDIYVLLEDIAGVDHVENVRFAYNGATEEDIVEVKQNFLVANGIHEVNIKLANGGQI